MSYLLWVTLAAATDLRTCPDLGCCDGEPLCFEDLQAAIDAASDGDTIRFDEGIYRTRAVIDNRRLTMDTVSPPEGTATTLSNNDTVLVLLVDPDVGEHDPLITVSGGSSDVTIRNLLFNNERNVAFDVREGEIALSGVQVTSTYSGLDGSNQGVGTILRASNGADVQIEFSRLLGGGDQFLHFETAQILLENADLYMNSSVLGDAASAAIRVPPGFTADITLTGALVPSEIRRSNSRGAGAINGQGTLIINGSVVIYNNYAFNFPYTVINRGAIVWRGDLTVEDAYLRGNSAAEGSAITWQGGGRFAMVRTTLCRNTGESLTDPSAAVEIADTMDTLAGDTAWISNNRFIENDVAIRLPLLSTSPSGYPVEIVHNHFLGNIANRGSVLHTEISDDDANRSAVVFSHNVLAFNYEIGNNPKAYLVSGATALRNLWWANGWDNSEEIRSFDPEAVLEDPLITVVTGECFRDEAGAIIGRPSYYGATRNRGEQDYIPPVPDPSEHDCADTPTDRDGSPPDLGAWGGPCADADEWLDTDEDGSPHVYDCAPGDPEKFPSVEEDGPLQYRPDIPCDDTDTNCRPEDDNDYDLDGFSPACTGTNCSLQCDGSDCDDNNAAISPDAPEIPGNGLDDDCDDWTDEGASIQPAGCERSVGCASLPGRGSALLLLLVGLCIARRSGAQEPSCTALDQGTFRSLMLDALTAADRANADLHRGIVMDLRGRLPCLQFAPSRREWAEYLVLEALMEFGAGGDWQAPLQAALVLRPSVDRGVSGRHPIARFELPPQPDPLTLPAPEGLNLYVDGEPATAIPASPGIHLVQREQDGRWRSIVARGEPVSIELLTAPFPVQRFWTTRGHLALGVGAGGAVQRRAGSWTSDEDAGHSVIPNGAWWDAWPSAIARGMASYGWLGLLGEVDAGLVDFSRVVGTHAQAFAGLATQGGTVVGVGFGVGGSSVVEGDPAEPAVAYSAESRSSYVQRTEPLYYAALTTQHWGSGGEFGLTAGAGASALHGSTFLGLHPRVGKLPLRVGLSGVGHMGRFVQLSEQTSPQAAATATTDERSAEELGTDARFWSVTWRTSLEIGVYRR